MVKTRGSTSRKRRIMFTSTPLERLFSKWVLKNVLHFSNWVFLFLWLSVRYFMSNNKALALHFLQRSRLCTHVVEQLIEHKSLIRDVKMDEELHRLHHTPILHLRIEIFQNNDHFE